MSKIVNCKCDVKPNSTSRFGRARRCGEYSTLTPIYSFYVCPECGAFTVAYRVTIRGVLPECVAQLELRQQVRYLKQYMKKTDR